MVQAYICNRRNVHSARILRLHCLSVVGVVVLSGKRISREVFRSRKFVGKLVRKSRGVCSSVGEVVTLVSRVAFLDKVVDEFY